MTALRLFHQSHRSSGSSSNSCPMALLLLRKWRWLSRAMRSSRSFRSDAALEALAKVSEVKTPNVIVLYNYPSFSGAFSPLPHFALLFRYSLQETTISMLHPEDREWVEMVLKYIEDGDLHRWSLADSRAFNTGINKWRSKLNCITNPLMYEQLMEMSSVDIIASGNSCVSTRQIAANKLLDKVFKVQLGRGFYGKCLGVRIDGHADLSDEAGKELSRKSADAGLRPIGAVIYMQRKNLKLCLKSMDVGTDTSEVAKANGKVIFGYPLL